MILPEEIARARTAAAASGKRAIEILQEHSGLEAEAFVAALGATLGYGVCSMDELDALLPAFDLLPYTDGLAHGCVLARTAQGELIMAFGDPFDPNLRPWAEERAPASMEWRLAHAADLSAYLARYGETMRAMDALR